MIVVDSGSQDGTPAIARGAGAQVVEIPAWSFSFGAALNRGCVEATGDILVALSAHAFPVNPGWLERLVGHFDDEAVACVTGYDRAPDGALLDGPERQDLEHQRRYPLWGYSNSAGGFRAELWRERPFRVDMPSTEDKEWALHWLRRGWSTIVDPAVVVDHDHFHDPVLEQARRSYGEWEGLAMFLSLPDYGFGALQREWWRDIVEGKPWRQRLSPARVARLAGKYMALRSRPPVAAGRPRPDRSLRIAVMTDRFLPLSETFVAGEISQLVQLGHQVSVEAITRSERPNWEVVSGVPVRFADEERLCRKLAAVTWLVAHHPLACLRDLASRRRWRTQETARPLRALAPRAQRLHASGTEHVHVHFAAAAALDAMRLGALLGLPYSVTAHAYEIFAAPSNLREKMERAAFVTTGCEYNVHHLRTMVHARDASRIHRLVMGVDGERFRRSRPYPGGRAVIAVGRLVEKKGFADLIDAVALLERESPADRLEIVGDGPLRDELRKRAERAGVDHRVTLAGARSADEIRARLQKADVLVMPCVVAGDGDRDSMPVAVKEAMAMEVPVVATREVGLPELVKPEWGRLVPPRDPSALAGALIELISLAPEDRARMGRSGREWVLEHGNIERETATLADLIWSVG